MILFFRTYFPVFALMFLANSLTAQVDTKFWFAAPEVVNGHGDEPLFLRISSQDKPATIKLFQPAISASPLRTVSVGINESVTIDLTSLKSRLENYPPDRVLNYGLLVESTAPVTAYYEVGHPYNSDIFVLKGKNALGNEFIIPSQNVYDNALESDWGLGRQPLSSFDIVATENNTVVTITPSTALYGHAENEPFIIKLNAGQTYSATNASRLSRNNFAGSRVVANKPIAITIKDDTSMNDVCGDLLGDQLVPINVTGEEYVIVKGQLENQEWAFITATEDSTAIYINGNSFPDKILNAGDLYSIRINNQSTYVLGSHPIYVYHVTGFGCEMGMAILPSINCKGSKQIGFTRSTSEFFALNILVRKGGINQFTLNNSTANISANAFEAVFGTNDQWYTAVIPFNTSTVPVEQGSLISNKEYSFQVGIINGDARSGCKYGYFSAFSTLFIGDDINICEGQSRLLDAGTDKQTYLWSTGATSNQIEINTPGTYWVQAQKEECLLADTIQVFLKQASINITDTVTFCAKDTAVVDGGENFSWLWSDQSKERYLRTTEPGKYWVTIRNYTGCLASDTFYIKQKPLPLVNLGEDIDKCRETEVMFDATYPDASYKWYNGETSPHLKTKVAGPIWVDVTLNGCTVRDSVIVRNNEVTELDSIFGSISVCPFVEGVSYEVLENDTLTYNWQVDGGQIAENTGNGIKVDWFATNPLANVEVTATESNGCLGDTLNLPVKINVKLDVRIPNGSDSLCLNYSEGNIYSSYQTAGSVYNWQTEGGVIVSGQGSNEVVINWLGEGRHKLWLTEESITPDTVCAGISDVLEVFVFADTTKLEIGFVTVDTSHADQIRLHWKMNNKEWMYGDSISIYKRLESVPTWDLLAEVPVSQNEFLDPDVSVNDNTYQYYLALENKCAEQVLSNVHNSILLTGEKDTINDIITLNWNAYDGWGDDIYAYEIWRQLDQESGFTYFKSVTAKELSYSGVHARDGFEHAYRIKAISSNGTGYSWSNTKNISFSHAVSVPNVITPNGDQFNQYFYIDRIELYPECELKIYNRWGRLVYEALGYNNDWDGQNLSSGQYYYSLKLDENIEVYNGMVGILR